MGYTAPMSAHEFVHLHTHSHYSLLGALPKISELVATAKADGQKALPPTDNGDLSAAIDFYKECKANGLKPIIGVDFYVAPRKRHDKQHRVDDRHSRLILLAKNNAGYHDLIQLVSKSHLEGFYYRPRIDRELIGQYRDGLIAILPSFGGEHARALRDGNREEARETLAWYKKIFGEDCFVEITRHPEIDGHEKNMQEIIAHDFSFISQARAEELFSDLPEALENSARIASRCDLTLKLGSWVFPAFPIPEGSTADKELAALAG